MFRSAELNRLLPPLLVRYRRRALLSRRECIVLWANCVRQKSKQGSNLGIVGSGRVGCNLAEMGSIEVFHRKRDSYEQAKFPGGALVIARGIGGDFLVVANGPETGNVWRNGINEIAPVCTAANTPWTIDYDNTSVRMSFADWFTAWLQYADKISLPNQDH